MQKVNHISLKVPWMGIRDALECIEMQSNEGERARLEAVTPYRSIQSIVLVKAPYFIIHLKAIELK